VVIADTFERKENKNERVLFSIEMSVKYRSTRGKQSGLSFEEVVLGGLANDRGLFVPESIPSLTIAEIETVCRLV
jgi:hypothetical protein